MQSKAHYFCFCSDQFKFQFKVKRGIVVVGLIKPSDFCECKAVIGEDCIDLLLMIGVHIENTCEVKGIVLDGCDGLQWYCLEDSSCSLFVICLQHHP